MVDDALAGAGALELDLAGLLAGLDAAIVGLGLRDARDHEEERGRGDCRHGVAKGHRCLLGRRGCGYPPKTPGRGAYSFSRAAYSPASPEAPKWPLRASARMRVRVNR